MVSIRRRGVAQFQARVRRRGYPDQAQTFETRAEALQWGRQVEREIALEVFSPEAAAARRAAAAPTLRDALQRYLNEVTPTKKGAANERLRVIRWQKHTLGYRSITDIRPSDMAAHRDQRMADGASGNTVRLDLAVISHLYTIARKEWGYEDLRNPVEGIRKPRLGPGREGRLAPEEEERLLEYCAATHKPLLAFSIRFAVETAMRRSELVGLRWERVDIARACALLPETKNGTPRVVPLSSRALAVLHELGVKAAGPVFPLRPNDVTEAFRRACRAVGIKGLRFHDLRHEATSRLFERGLSTMEVASVTGHKTLQMLQRYTHLRVSDLVNKLG